MCPDVSAQVQRQHLRSTEGLLNVPEHLQLSGKQKMRSPEDLQHLTRQLGYQMG